MRVSLVGADCEENLGLCMIAACLDRARHRVEVVGYNDLAEVDQVVERVMGHRPRLVGLGIQFQHGAYDFLHLAARLRRAGYAGHITCGGQYPTMAWREILEHVPAVDSIVLYEGEETIVELCRALATEGDLGQVAGLGLRNPIRRTDPRRLCPELDQLPFAYRYRAPARHLGLPFRPISGSRGCWGSCAFCAISTFYRDARASADNRLFRLRSPENLAAEMAALHHETGGSTIFCFHDDNFLLPRPADTLARLRRLRSALDELGVGPVGLVGKCRPDCVSFELARELRRLGVFRMFVGVENGSQRGLDHLGRKTTLADIEQALGAFAAAGIFVCYNLLLFEPETVLDDVRENIEFIRRHASVPVNFCRAEPYHGTPLHQRVREQGSLLGSYLGWDYRLRDDRTELVFRVASSVFRQRNYDPEGVANRTIGLGYTAQLLRCFFDVSRPGGRRLIERAERLIEDVSRDTADLLEQAVEIGARADLAAHDRITRETAVLGLRVAGRNRLWHAALDDLTADIARFAAEEPRSRSAWSGRARAALERVALAGCVAATVQACGGETETGPGGGAGAGTAGTSAGRAGTGGYIISDPVAPTGGMSTGGRAGSSGGFFGDPVVPTGGTATGGQGTGGYVVDCVPAPMAAASSPSVVDPAPPGAGERRGLVEHWHETTPRRLVRSEDLPLFDPPLVRLESHPTGSSIRVAVAGGEPEMTLRWQAEGSISGEDRQVIWEPASAEDALTVVVRGSGGITFATLRARDLLSFAG
jgi:anaerobic magnesium-protoporphyrin IX monomethyl ester cyclase